MAVLLRRAVLAVGAFTLMTAGLLAAPPATRADGTPEQVVLDGYEVVAPTAADFGGYAIGTYFANASTDAGADSITVTLTLTDVGTVTSWGVYQGHTGDPGSGVPVIPLSVTYDAAGQLSAMVDDASFVPTIRAIEQAPTNYFLQVNTTTGAIRGPVVADLEVSGVPALSQEDLKGIAPHPEVACGPTSAAMVIQHYYSAWTFPGLPTLLDVYDQMDPQPEKGVKFPGWSIYEVAAVFAGFDRSATPGDTLQPGTVFVPPNWPSALGLVRAQLDLGRPVIALLGGTKNLPAWKGKDVDGHFVVITAAIDNAAGADGGLILYNDPKTGPSEATYAEFFNAWGKTTPAPKGNVTIPFQMIMSSPD